MPVVAFSAPLQLCQWKKRAPYRAKGVCWYHSRNVATTKKAYKMALEKVGLCQNDKGGITMQAWIERLKHPDTAELIETMHGSFKRGRKGKRRREENT